MDLVGHGGEDTVEAIQCVLFYQRGWQLIPDGYGPGEQGVLVDISVRSGAFEFIPMVGSCISWGWVILLGYGYQMVEGLVEHGDVCFGAAVLQGRPWKCL